MKCPEEANPLRQRADGGSQGLGPHAYGTSFWGINKTLMLGKIDGKRRRGWQRMKWPDSITNSMGVTLSKRWEIVEDRGAWHAAVRGVRVGHDLATEQQHFLKLDTTLRISPTDAHAKWVNCAGWGFYLNELLYEDRKAAACEDGLKRTHCAQECPPASYTACGQLRPGRPHSGLRFLCPPPHPLGCPAAQAAPSSPSKDVRTSRRKPWQCLSAGLRFEPRPANMVGEPLPPPSPQGPVGPPFLRN